MCIINNGQGWSVAEPPAAPPSWLPVMDRGPFNRLATSGHFSLTIKLKEEETTKRRGICLFLAFIPDTSCVRDRIPPQYRASHTALVCLAQQFIRVMSELALRLFPPAVNKPCLGDSYLSDILEYSPEPWSHFAVAYKHTNSYIIQRFFSPPPPHPSPWRCNLPQ